MIHPLLLRKLTSPETARRLNDLACGAPASALVSLRLELPALLTDWLHFVPVGLPWWYRAQPDRDEYRLGIGHAMFVETAGSGRFPALDNALSGLCSEWRRNGPALAFSGFAFDDNSCQPLPNALIAVPAILLERVEGCCSLTLTSPACRIRHALAEWPAWLAGSQPGTSVEAQPGSPEPLAEQAWMARVVAALRDIAGGRLDKVVLTRCQHLEGNAPLSPAAILDTLNAQQAGSLIYAHGNGRQTFLGATPERLIRKCGRRIDVDALAGTSWPGSPALADDKNRHEQSLVVRAVVDALSPWCDQEPMIGLPEEQPAGRLRHWRSRISAQSHPGCSLFDLVRALHPTPAVGGFPTDAAHRWLAAHGERRHGWYSGGIGTLTPEGDGEFFVALRSALIDGRRATLQAGAGIVAGSDPEQELAETEAKLGTMLTALEGCQSRHLPRRA